MIEIRGVRAVLTDIEGTTTSLAFVHEQLFPYARKNLAGYVRQHESELGDIASQIEAATGRGGLGTHEIVAILLQWMAEDRKLTPLKTLQGMIWRSGYDAGRLQGHVYDDAVRALREWHANGIGIFIYSSGSVEAQRLLFSHSSHGDLTPLLSGYFDTTTGAKLDSRSYDSIARSIGLGAQSIVFLSDHPGESHAAAAAGMRSVLVAREEAARDAGPGRDPEPGSNSERGRTYPAVRSFDDLRLSA